MADLMGNQNISPVEERLSSPSAPRVSADYSIDSIVNNQYRIDEKIGDGGMGTVYRCTDLVVRRTVAIKFLHPHLVNTSKWLLRFQQEATAIGRLHHPNVIRIHQFCAEADPPFIVMDYVEGKSLSDVLACEGSLSLKRCICLMKQVADALSHAHDMGVVHRDLKPSNVIILKNDVVQILDFGIAKLDDGADTQSAIKLTQTGEVFGSPAYMSPEQCLGKRINAQSDQYSFGCMIYECLTGSPPFVGISPVEVIMKHVSDSPPSLKESSLGKQFPSELELLVQKLLAKQPENRFESMKDAKEALVEVGNSGTKFEKASSAKKVESKTPVSLKLVGVSLLGLAAIGILIAIILNLSETPDQKPAQKNPTTVANKVLTEEEQLTISANLGLIQELKALSQQKPEVLRFGPPKQRAINGEALEAFSIYLPTICILTLNRCEIGDQGLENLVKLKKLRSLYLNGNTKITNAGLKTLSQISSLWELQIAGSSTDDEGMKELAKMPNLISVNVAYIQRITSRGIQTLASTHRLRFLFLNYLDIRGASAALAQNPLEQLILDNCTFGDADLENISQIKTLTGLSLSNTNIYSGTKFNSLMKMKNLKHLKIANCKHISIEMLDKLKKALPGCVVDSF
jgi:serine/threonine protein kinase